MSEADESSTAVQFGLRARIYGVPFELVSTVGGPDGWSFAGRAVVRRRLSELLSLLQGPAGEGEAWFADAPLVDIDVTALAASYRAASGSFSLRSDFDVLIADGPQLGLAFLFARSGAAGTGGEAAEGHVLAGLFSRDPIDFAEVLGTGSGLIGRFLGGFDLDSLGIFYSSAAQEIEGTLVDAREAGPVDFGAGLSVTARLGANGNYTEIVLPPPPASKAAAAPDAPAASVPAKKAGLPARGAAPMRFWKPLDKTIGPLQLRRIGGEWHDGKLGILLDAEVALAGLKVGLAGLAVKVPPSKLSTLAFSDLEFALDGLELAFSRGPVSIGGALLRTFEGDRVGYAGAATIRAAAFSIAAIGAYSTTAEEQPAFFIFGAYSGTIGGPPCFVVTGIAAGFGYNRAITLPEIDEVREFPLVSLVLGTSEAGAGSMIESLGAENRFPPVTGQYWLAAGVRFTSFKLVDAFALVTVQFGTRFELALLGVATLRQPPAPAPRALVFVEMALKVRFAPDDGLLSVMAVLTDNSFLFDTRCKLTGGFAFCVWLPPTDPRALNRAGDFVLTLGGYHPKFEVPAHYPKVPRIGFNWQLPECGVAIRGEAYFALTPSFIMAGARLSAVFRAGGFSAWFDAHADFLIGWAPLHYEADVGVRIGASYAFRLGAASFTLSFELAANLTIWGPPFAGEVHVDLGIVAFTVPIGDRSASRQPERIWWPDFDKAFLPPAPLAIAIAAGLIEERTGDGGYIIVNPSELCLAVESFIPVASLEGAIVAMKGAPVRKGPPPPLGIRPLAQPELKSRLLVAFAREAKDGQLPRDDHVVHRPMFKSAPEALWSSEPMPDARGSATLSAKVIEEVLMGVQVLPAECRKFRAIGIEVAVRSETAPLPGRPRHDWTDAPYAEPEERAAMFRRGWKPPEAAVMASVRDFGFPMPQPTVTGAFPDLWQATPALVPIGQLPAPEHGA
jgi:hypothetical protein